jgi:hypothetical protein
VNTPQESVAETLRQVIHGRDFDAVAKTLKTISNESATTLLPHCPYTIATNVSHAEQWQRSWLHKLMGLPTFDVWKHGKDFPVVTPNEWPHVREGFLKGLEDALSIAETVPFVHHMADDVKAMQTLNRIAVHGAYHIGQVRLLKRMLWASRKQD